MIEIMGPPASGKSTFAGRITAKPIPEALPALRRAGRLPAAGPGRQRLLLLEAAAAATRSGAMPGSRPVFDAGPLSTLAFTKHRFGPDVARATLRSTLTHVGDNWLAFERLIWLDAPLAVLVDRAEMDASRRRRNFESNVQAFRCIRRSVTSLMAMVPKRRALRIDTTSLYQVDRAVVLLRKQRFDSLSPGKTIDLIERWLT